MANEHTKFLREAKACYERHIKDLREEARILQMDEDEYDEEFGPKFHVFTYKIDGREELIAIPASLVPDARDETFMKAFEKYSGFSRQHVTEYDADETDDDSDFYSTDYRRREAKEHQQNCIICRKLNITPIEEPDMSKSYDEACEAIREDNEPSAVTVKRMIEVELGGGGPAYGYHLFMSSDGREWGFDNGYFWYQDWGKEKERFWLSNDELEQVVALYDLSYLEYE